ncbi:MAG TPA: tRNA (adenosine(37)-N6)-threonylcarbamoyltransferase complex dimerization subunit type 1 TsaB [Stellaceae bacterium]|nr:tRNA (adenosine(37)-N6)-threonylcarbamoyltransferase complex dimerization subunit type 1 TsaB [Stellaceae bacterium]
MDEVNRQAAAPALPRTVLAFDCSGASCSAAVLSEGDILAHRFAAMARGQAEALVPMIGEVMAQAGLSFVSLDAIVTTVGPGSFTGIRLGLAAAQGLALASSRPILAVSAFEAHLAGLGAGPPAHPVLVAIDSRRGPVFAQVFGTNRAALTEPMQLEPAEVERHLPAGPVVAIGDGAVLLKGYVDPARIGPAGASPHIDAAALARLVGGALAWRPRVLAPVPLYLRPPDVTTPKPRP